MLAFLPWRSLCFYYSSVVSTLQLNLAHILKQYIFLKLCVINILFFFLIIYVTICPIFSHRLDFAGCLITMWFDMLLSLCISWNLAPGSQRWFRLSLDTFGKTTGCILSSGGTEGLVYALFRFSSHDTQCIDPFIHWILSRLYHFIACISWNNFIRICFFHLLFGLQWYSSYRKSRINAWFSYLFFLSSKTMN